MVVVIVKGRTRGWKGLIGYYGKRQNDYHMVEGIFERLVKVNTSRFVACVNSLL